MTKVRKSVDFPFSEDRFPADLGAVVQKTVAEEGKPALVVIHDDDNEWLIGDGINEPSPDACSVYHIAHIVDSDAALLELVTLPIGYIAERNSPSDPWMISRWTYPDDLL